MPNLALNEKGIQAADEFALSYCILFCYDWVLSLEGLLFSEGK